MPKYFILDNLDTSDIIDDLWSYTNSFDNWSKYGYGRFTLYVGLPERDKIIPLAKKFKNPRDIIKKLELNYVPAGGIVMPHTDHNRNLTLNIPIKGDFENSTLDFYDKTFKGKLIDRTDSDNTSYETSARAYVSCPLAQQISYQKPICFDTQDVHGVTNQTNQDRYIMTISIKDDITIEQLENMYNNGELLV